MSASNHNFAISLNGLRLQARAHDIDINTEAMQRFLVHLAEVDAQEHEALREAETFMHLKTCGE